MATPASLVFSDVHQAQQYLAPLRAQGKSLATTNGCFDILHAGHIQYLTEAATQADMLVVGINSDDSVRKLKGPSRPIQNELDRALIIASLKMVTCSFVFREDDPRAFLEVLRPQVHVKGGDYSVNIIEKPIVEAYGGKICIVSYVAGRSTTNILRAATQHK